MRGSVEYALSPNLRLGLAGRYEKAGIYTEGAGLLYLRYRLDRPREELTPLLGSNSTVYPAASWPLASTLVNGAPQPVQLPNNSTHPVW